MKKIAVLASIGMLAIAVVVVLQVAHPTLSLQGQVTNEIGGSSESCELKVVNGIIQECCKQTYTAFYNCTNFSGDFHNRCVESGLNCKAIETSCLGNENSHAINLVEIDGQWCLVEPQGELGECYEDQSEISGSPGLCELQGIPLREDGSCSCRIDAISDDPLPISTDTGACSTDSTSVQQCSLCCDTRIQYYKDENVPEWQRWLDECNASCTGSFSSSSCGGTAGQCGGGCSDDSKACSWVSNAGAGDGACVCVGYKPDCRRRDCAPAAGGVLGYGDCLATVETECANKGKVFPLRNGL